MYRYSKVAKDKYLKEPILAYLFIWFAQNNEAKAFISDKFADKNTDYRERMRVEMEDLR